MTCVGNFLRMFIVFQVFSIRTFAFEQFKQLNELVLCMSLFILRGSQSQAKECLGEPKWGQNR